tara:strand:- start:1056 stop:1913 length:858 start_codon:yes stop_codon:yes gene_type:complete
MKNYKDKITAVIILYNVTDVIFECLKNLKNIKIIIADNGDNNPDTIKEIKKNKNIVKYFRFKKNIGFGRACNFCLRYVETDFTLLINPDALIKENDLKILEKSFENYPNAGIVVPTLVDIYGKNKDKLENLPELNALNSNHKYDGSFEGDTCVNFCWAAIWLLNNRIIKDLGLFNKDQFIYWEDFYLCRKLKKKGIPIIKIYESKAIHNASTSTKKTIKSNFIIYKHHILSSYIYFNVQKKSFYLKKKLLVYFFRSISYLLILNLNNSLKNFARLCAVISYINKK